jgi:hypothetical protein
MTTVQVKYSTATDLTGATTTAAVTADTSADLTGAVDLSGLAAGTKYYYDVLVDGTGQLAAPYPSFSTFPASGSPAQFSFAFGSCTKHADTISADTIFDALPANIAFLMHLGDVIYADRDAPTTSVLSGYRQKHRDVLAGSDSTSASFKALRQRTPVFTMLDDHDIVNDVDGSTSRTIVADAKQAFSEYPARANPDSLTAGELYYAFQVGDVGFFVTDSRTMRSANSATDDSNKTILGSTQKAALKDWLLTNKTALKLKFICATTPMHGYAANTGGDSWGGIDDGTQAPNGANGFRTERNEIWDYIDANQIPGVVVISGDQHWAGSFKTTYAGRPRYEFMATPYNMTNTATFMLTAVARAADPVNGPVLWKLDNTMNAGVVSVDTTVSPATVSFQLYGTGGSLGASYLTSITSDDIDANLIPAPAITLSATFPTSPKVGDVVNFDVTATLANGATGTLTITQDTLPAGLSLGATSLVDATHYKATVSGTLTTAATGTTSFGATGGSVAAQALEWDWTVSAAASSPVLVQLANKSPSSTTDSIPLDSPATAGNALVLCVVARNNQPPATPSGWTKADDLLLTGTSVGHVWWFKKLAVGGETSIPFTWAALSTINAFAVAEWQGDVTLSGFSGSAAGTANPASFTSGTPPANAMALFFGDATTLTSNASATLDNAWTYKGPTQKSGTQYGCAFIGTKDAAGAAVTATVTYSGGTPDNTYGTFAWVTKA